MVAMVNKTYLRELEAAARDDDNFTYSLIKACDLMDVSDDITKLSNMTEQVVLSAVASTFHKLFNLFFHFCWVLVILFYFYLLEPF